MLMLASMLGLMAMGGIALMGESIDGDVDEDANTQDHDDIENGGTEDTLFNQILSGDDQNNDIVGGLGDDQINGYGGDDAIAGGAGDDVLHGGDGVDNVDGGAGEDTLHGDDGDDLLSGASGDDQIFGHEDDDTLHGDDGQDMLVGGGGDDILSGDSGDDALHGDIGNDRLDGGEGADTLFGGQGDDWMTGREGTFLDPDDPEMAQRDYLNGGIGDDVIIAGQSDVVTSGAGEDTIVLGDWIAGGQAASVMDYDTEQDQLMMVCDLAGVSDPQIEIFSDADVPGLNHIMLDGVEIAKVQADRSLEVTDIILIDHSQARSFTLNP